MNNYSHNSDWNKDTLVSVINTTQHTTHANTLLQVAFREVFLISLCLVWLVGVCVWCVCLCVWREVVRVVVSGVVVGCV